MIPPFLVRRLVLPLLGAFACVPGGLRAEKPTTTDFYHPADVQDIQLDISSDHVQEMHAALPKRIYVPATFRWRDVELKRVGVRFKGNSSSQPWQKHKRSFLIKFNEFEKGERFLGLRRIALDNGVQFGSLFSERLITDILRELDVNAPRSNYARLVVNGFFWGVYVNVERIDETYIETHFGKPIGNLYKVDEGGPGCNLQYLGDEPSRYAKAFEPKTNDKKANHRDIAKLIRTINYAPAAEFATTLDEVLETDAFLHTMAVMCLAGAFDQLTGWNPHNYYVYHDPRTKKWNYLPWDLDVGFADNAFGKIPVISGWNAAWPLPGQRPNPLVYRILSDDNLLARYRVIADEVLEKHFHPDVLSPKVDELYASIATDLANDPFPKRRATVPTDTGYDGIVYSIKVFIYQRYWTARRQLDSLPQ